ncbi:prepilin-type N-terminal cleavage/methylation domain-containing protein [Pseudanabaenaceae cyanobacterium LEGE 13415]|nr:prepilin-type N-terminal cleavage/methylation domain-containing protein [Pseudanabaenaceae cyanobacterium LEGE 13415]
MNDDRHKTQAGRFGTVQTDWLMLNSRRRNSSCGFTLLEAISSLVLIGILAAIVAPSWQAYLNAQRLNVARNAAVGALNDAKTRAKHQHITYEVGFRQQGQLVQWAVYPDGADPLQQNWQNLNEGVKLLEAPETTMARRQGIYRVQFNDRGEANGQLGGVVFGSAAGGGTKRCVIVSNLLGTIREGENRPTRQNNPCE